MEIKGIKRIFTRIGRVLGVAGVSGLLVLLPASVASAQTLKVFVGSQARPEAIKALLAQYMALHPEVKVELETGGATSELQQKYLNTMLSAGDASLDVFLIDIVRPAQYATAGWSERMDKYLGADREKILDQYLPAYKQANIVDNRVVALPAFADALFLYYRKDLLQKYALPPPKTWDELSAAARTVLDKEKSQALQGISFQGKAIEGTVCTFLLPYWSQGGELIANGKLSLDKPKAEAGLNMWLDMVRQGVAPKNIAEVATDDTRKDFQAGNAVFAVNWGYAWSLFQNDPESRVKDKVGIIRLPAMKGGQPVSCIGGWAWTVSAYSKNKEAAVKLVRWLASIQVSRELAIKAGSLPAFTALYKDKQVLAAYPWMADALPVVQSARSRPVTARYFELSEVLRNNTNAVLAGVKKPADAVNEIENRAGRILR